MPTYDYKCEACDHVFEEFQSITAKPLKKCPACGKNKLQRLIGIGAGVIFKGSGFYETDYRSDSYKAAAKKDKESASGSSSAGEGKKENGAAATGKTEAAPKADTKSDKPQAASPKASSSKAGGAKAASKKASSADLP